MKTFSLPKNSTLVNLIYINIGVFLAAKLIGIVCTLFNLNSFSALSYLHLTAQINLLLKQPWSVLTYMFLHTDFFHLFFNMYTLYFFGRVLEERWGAKKFLIFYFVTGLGAALVHTGVEYLQMNTWMSQVAEGSMAAQARIHALKMTPTVGASGAIYGGRIPFSKS